MKTKGVASWAYLKQPDTKWDNHMWCITLELSQEEAAQLRAAGLVVKDHFDKDGNKIKTTYKFRRYIIKRDGTGRKNKKPLIVDPAKKPFTGIVGNGSIVNVIHKPYMSKKFKKVGTDLVAVQVIKLVPYEFDENKFSDFDEGSIGEFEVEGDAFKEEDIKPTKKEEEEAVPVEEEELEEEVEDDDPF